MLETELFWHGLALALGYGLICWSKELRTRLWIGASGKKVKLLMILKMWHNLNF